jgi:hypothetical protein
MMSWHKPFFILPDGQRVHPYFNNTPWCIAVRRENGSWGVNTFCRTRETAERAAIRARTGWGYTEIHIIQAGKSGDADVSTDEHERRANPGADHSAP